MQTPPVVIKVRDDGPLKVSGPFVLVDVDGRELPLPDGPVALCRCGGSGDKPFCDGSHRTCGFSSRVRAGDTA